MLSLRCAKIIAKRLDQIVEERDALVFQVYDTGIGISKKNQQSLFKLFGKVNQVNKGINKEGIGLGLYITKNLVE